jgi:hypothetical protein
LSHFNEAEVEGCGFKMAFLIAKTSTMAKDKNSFLIYCDIIHTVDKLDDLQAGKLFKHLLKYVNDLNPVADDIVTEIAFEPIKQSLKRDLQKYESIRERNSENAKKRWNATASDRIPKEPKRTKNADSVSDSDISKDINKRKQEFAFKLTSFVDTYGKSMIRDFYDYWTEHGEKDKKMRYEKETSFNLDARLNRWNKNVQERNKPKETEEPKELLLARKLGLC